MQQAALFRRERHLVVNMVLGFVCDYQRDLRDTSVFFFGDCLSTLVRLFSRRWRRSRRGMQQAALFRRERHLVVNMVFGGSSAIISEISEIHLWFRLVQYNLSPLACYSPADPADYAEEYSKAVLFRRERQLGDGYCCFMVLGFVCDYQRDLRETLGFRLCNID